MLDCKMQAEAEPCPTPRSGHVRSTHKKFKTAKKSLLEWRRKYPKSKYYLERIV